MIGKRLPISKRRSFSKSRLKGLRPFKTSSPSPLKERRISPSWKGKGGEVDKQFNN